MKILLIIPLLITSLLTGCSTFAPTHYCIATENPEEKVINAKITEKKEIPGPVILTPSTSVKVSNTPLGSSAGSNQVIALTTLVIVGTALGADPMAIQNTSIQMMANPSFHTNSTIPPNSETTVGEECKQEEIFLENGAIQYTVTSESTIYQVNSAYRGFEVGDCVKVFISKTGKASSINSTCCTWIRMQITRTFS